MQAAEPFHIAQDAFDFIDDIERLNTQPAVMDRLNSEFAKFGFEAWVVTGLPLPGERMEETMMLNGWSEEWSRMYMEREYAMVDPVAQYCFRSIGPFEWKDAPYNPQVEKHAKAVMDHATEFRMAQGFSIPIHTYKGFQAVVSMGGQHVDLSANSKRALHLMAIYAHARAVAVVRPHKEMSHRLLTEREREILRWTAVGKTAWEISQILAISAHTVHQHLKIASRKLNTPTKTSTVVTAMRRKEIEL